MLAGQATQPRHLRDNPRISRPSTLIDCGRLSLLQRRSPACPATGTLKSANRGRRPTRRGFGRRAPRLLPCVARPRRLYQRCGGLRVPMGLALLCVPCSCADDRGEQLFPGVPEGRPAALGAVLPCAYVRSEQHPNPTPSCPRRESELALQMLLARQPLKRADFERNSTACRLLPWSARATSPPTHHAGCGQRDAVRKASQGGQPLGPAACRRREAGVSKAFGRRGREEGRRDGWGGGCWGSAAEEAAAA